MSDPRNVAHEKKVTQEKQHENAKTVLARRSRRSKKTAGDGNENGPAEAVPAPNAAKAAQGPGDLEKSMVVLSKLKEMEFHSRGNIETLAQLTLTIEEELKQGEFSEAIGAVYSAQDAFHSKIATLIETYEAKCEALKGPA